MANALKVPISVMDSAGEGGAWGMAILALYLNEKGDLSLEDFLVERVFNNEVETTIEPNEEDMAGFDVFLENYKSSLAIQRAAVDSL